MGSLSIVSELIIPVVMCVNMADYLTITLEKNRHYFQNYIVVTSPDDHLTLELCEKYSVQTITYDNFFPLDAKFNKAGGLLYAQQQLHEAFPEKWILMMDVDIVIPSSCISTLQYCIDNGLLDTTQLYSVKRFDVLTHDELEDECQTREYTLPGAGYFQLYYDKTKYYNSFSESAAQTDIYFAFKFEKRILITTHIYHLGEEGMHWNGRGKPWGL